MMIVKAHDGNGNWHLFEAHWDLTFSGPSVMVEVPVDYGEQGPEANLDPKSSGGHLPYAEYTHVTHIKLVEGDTSTFVRWVKWLDEDDESHRLITQHEVFICNSEGQTVEALR